MHITNMDLFMYGILISLWLLSSSAILFAIVVTLKAIDKVDGNEDKGN